MKKCLKRLKLGDHIIANYSNSFQIEGELVARMGAHLVISSPTDYGIYSSSTIFAIINESKRLAYQVKSNFEDKNLNFTYANNIIKIIKSRGERGISK